MNVYLTCLTLALVQLILARALGSKTPRALAWMGAMACFYLMHEVAINTPSLLRMITLCMVLMAGMKWIVYREWSAEKNRSLSWCRWWMFSTLWFGMDPNSFAAKRRNRQWKSHAMKGMAYLLTGGVLWFGCYYFQLSNIVFLFVSMSMVVHFGVLRLSAAFWRWQGFPVLVLFRNPLKMSGFRDFWSKRWNLAYTQMMARTVQRPLAHRLGEKGSVFAVFLVSGLFHELAITVPVQAGYGLPTAFFIIHGVCTVLEKKASKLNTLACAALLIGGLPYLFNETFQTEVIYPSRDIFNLTKQIK